MLRKKLETDSRVRKLGRGGVYSTFLIHSKNRFPNLSRDRSARSKSFWEILFGKLINSFGTYPFFGRGGRCLGEMYRLSYREIGDVFPLIMFGRVLEKIEGGRLVPNEFHLFTKSVSKSLQRSIGSVQIFLGNSFLVN